MLLLLTALASLQPTPAPAAIAPSPAPVSTAPAPVAKPPAAEERKICKRDASSSSRLGSKRICLTQAQWRARDSELRGLDDVSK